MTSGDRAPLLDETLIRSTLDTALRRGGEFAEVFVDGTNLTNEYQRYYLVWPDRQQESAALLRFRALLLAQARSVPPHRPQG